MICSAASVAAARDSHYHNPPHYLVLEPEDTSKRTSNLQQTNTNGYVFQGNNEEFMQVKAEIDSWENGYQYSTQENYQRKIKSLIGKYNYRLDTNFAKIDRIQHPDIELFKTRVLNTVFKGKTIKAWTRTLARADEETIIREILPLL